MTEQEKQKLKDALIEHKNIATSEYDDEDAFVGIYFSDLVDIIDSVIDNTGWHPASELPPVNKDTGYSDVVCFYATARDGRKLFLFEGRYCEAYIGEKKAHNPFINDGWCYADGGKINEVLNVKWWCYPPKKE